MHIVLIFPKCQFSIINSVFYCMEQVVPSPAKGKKMSEEQLQLNKGDLFECAIAKYFEIIKTILPRISTLYLQNQQFEKNLIAIESKMAKIEKDNQNLHYQMRTNHLAFDNKFNHVLADYSNLTNQFLRIKQQNDDLCRELNEIKYIQTTHKQAIVERIVEKVDREETIQRQQRTQEVAMTQFKKQKSKKITFLEKLSENDKQADNQQLKNKISVRAVDRKSSIDVDVEEIDIDLPQEAMIEIKKSSHLRSVIEVDSAQSNHTSKIQSQNSFDVADKNRAIAMKSQKVMYRKTNLKSSTCKVSVAKEMKKDKEVSVNKVQSQKVLGSKSADEFNSSDNYRQILKEIQDFYQNNQSIKKNYEYLMGEYCRNSQQQYLKLQEQINQLKTKIAQIDTLHTHFDRIKIQLQNKVSSCSKDTEIKINSKLDMKQFYEYMQETNARLTAIHEERRKVANKDQTKRAIEFIDRKLNHMIEEVLPTNEHKYPKLHMVDLEISHLTSRTAAIPIKNQKNPVFMQCGDRTSKNSEHTTRQATLETYSTSNRLAESVHQKVRSGKMVNEEQSELCPIYKQRTPDRNSIWKNRKINDRDSLAYLRDSSRELLSRGEKKKTRNKLKKERIFFEYD